MNKMNVPFSDADTLARAVAAHVDVEPEKLTLSRCSTGKFNTTYFVGGGPEPLVLRIAPPDDPSRYLFYEYRMMKQEPAIHEAVQAQTDTPVPRILAFDESREHLDTDFLVMERLPGTPASEYAGLTRRTFDSVLRRIGECLRQVHDITGDQYGYVGPHAPMEPQTDWPSAFHIMWNLLIDDTVRCGGYTDEEGDRMRALLDAHAAVFERDVPVSLLHMDVWAQNILIGDDGQLTGLVDWDRGLWGDPEIEFAVLDYCGISEPAFWEGYGRERDLSPEARVRGTFYLLYELQKYILIRRVRGGDPAAADGYRRRAFQIARALEG
jgi:aminoglycoside phosphotransferase (APT) family kinase protein